jgi:hypothetical protein
MKRRTSTPPAQPTPPLPTDVATLQTQLRLARAQNAYLHRQLQGTTPAAPSAPSTGLAPTGQRGPAGTTTLDEDIARLKARLDTVEATLQERLAKAKVEYRTLRAASLEQQADAERMIARLTREAHNALWAD